MFNSSGRIFVSRHIVSDETQFPFIDKTHSFSLHLIWFLLVSDLFRFLCVHLVILNSPA